MPCPWPVGVFQNTHTGEKIYAACKQWDCPHCGPVKKNQLLDRVAVGFGPTEIDGERVANIRMLTLTLRAGVDDTMITKYWNTLRVELKDSGYAISKFFWTKEFTKRGVRHLHVLIDRYIPHGVVRRLWRRITHSSFIVHITRMNLKNPAGYSSKYMSKGFLQGKFRKYERRFGCSRHFKPIKKISSDGTYQFLWNPHLGFLVWKHSIYGQGFDTADSWSDAYKSFVAPSLPSRVRPRVIRPLSPPESACYLNNFFGPLWFISWNLYELSRLLPGPGWNPNKRL